ncbi:MAG: hypothetical protein HY219_02175, partial [Candidatus Staskawiczbacteria bacterium]|nr:hypothetical protein [Candidatus Staskawiczbacteria bacterium]
KEDSTLIIDPLYNQEGLIKAYQVKAKAIEKMLKETKPDFVLFSFIGNISQLLIAQVAKKMGIKTLSIEFCKIGNRIDLTADHFTITGLKEETEKIKNGGEQDLYFQEGKKLIENFKKTGSLKLDYIEEYKKILAEKKAAPLTKKIWGSTKYFFLHWKNYFKYKNIFIYHDATRDPFRFYYQKIRRILRQWRGLNDLYSLPNYQEDYVFYPLHYEPEISIQVQSPFYFDQVSLLRYISRSVPLHFKIYVKDHPQTPFNRPRSYFKEILKLPNVKLIDHRTSSFELIKNTKIVLTISGTAGFEASLLGKPVITFGGVFYNILSGVTRIHEIEKLPDIVNNLLKNFKPDQKETVRLVGTILKDSIAMDFSYLRSEMNIEKLKNSNNIKQFCDLIMRKLKQ